MAASRRIAISAGSLAVTLGALDTYVVVTIMSDIMRDVGIGINQIQKVTHPSIVGTVDTQSTYEPGARSAGISSLAAASDSTVSQSSSTCDGGCHGPLLAGPAIASTLADVRQVA